MITDVEGIEVGHWTDPEARTGCTVVLFPEGTVASGEVRGGAPATREFALLDPTRQVARLDALVLTGGSAFGLAAADGVMAWCEARSRGFPTAGGVVPIVVALALYDLAVGDPTVRPGPAEGRAAADSATGGGCATGLVGAGTGATVDKWRGPGRRRPGGLVTASLRRADGLVVAALVAVNAFGEPGLSAAAATGELRGSFADATAPEHPAEGNTTIGLVATNARLDKLACHLVAQSAHDGLARSVAPAHTLADGDAFVAAATGTVEAELGAVRSMGVAVVESAILSLAIGTAATGGLGGDPPTDRG